MARIQRTVQKRSSQPRYSRWCDHSPRARHPGMWSQVGLRKHHYEQSRMEFQQSYFKSWKMMLRKGCTQYASKFGKLSSGHRTGKGQFSFQSQKKGNAKECSNYCTIALISHASKVMLKILQDRSQQYSNHEIPDFQAGFRKSRGTRYQIANICWIIKKAREF